MAILYNDGCMSKTFSKELETTSLIHLHTDVGSVGDGAGKISDYMEKFKNIGVEFATLTDHGDISGLLQFYKAAKKSGINPGLGCEFYLNDKRDADLKPAKKKHKEDAACTHETKALTAEERKAKREADKEDDNPDDAKNNHIIITAKNEQGVKNIIRINNEAVMNGFYRKPRTTTERIFELAGNDVLISSGCLAGFPARMILSDRIPQLEKRLMEWKERFGDDFYLELQFNELGEQHIVNAELMQIGKRLGIKCIIAQDCHYVDEGEHFLQMLKMLSRTRSQLRNMEDGIPKGMWIFEATELFVKSNEGVIKTAKKFNYDIKQNDIIDALVHNQEWHHKTRTHWDLSVKHYNKYEPPAGFKDSNEYFNHLLAENMKTFVLKGYIPRSEIRTYLERIDYERKMLIEKEYVDYLLETKRAIDKVIEAVGGDGAHIGIARGSCAASLCAYLLGIHKIDPIRHDLLFDRFLSEARSNEMVDIDI